MAPSKPPRFYVMECVEGDELLVSDCETLPAAREALEAHARASTNPHLDLSIWQSNGPILMLWDRQRGFITPPGRQHG